MLREEQLVGKLVEGLDEVERACGVAYYCAEPIKRGALLDVPRLVARAPSDALLAFVDRDPTANWGHSSRYVLLDRETGREVLSIEAQLPPFGPSDKRQWRVAYRAPSVPEAVIAVRP